MTLPQAVVTLECAKRFKPSVRLVEGRVLVMTRGGTTVPVAVSGTGKDRVQFVDHLQRVLLM